MSNALAFDRSGHGSPVLFLHAAIADRRMWEPQLCTLADKFDMVAPDLPGFGASPAPTEPMSVRRELVGLLDHCEMGQVDLIGCSFGGITALDFTLERPERVRRLVLIDAGISGLQLGIEDHDLFADIEAAEATGDTEALNEAEIRLWVDGPGRPAGYVAGAARSLVLKMNGDSLRAPRWDGALLQPLDPPASGRLGDVRVPTLILVGEFDLPHCHKAAAILAHSIPGSRLETVPDTAHLPSLERPDLVNPRLNEFLTSA